MIPDYQTLMRPVLVVLADQQVYSLSELRDRVASFFSLSDDERAETLPSGPRIFDNRVQWALLYLKQAGLVVRPKRAQLQITDQGLSVLKEHSQIDKTTLLNFESYREFVSPTSKKEQVATRVIQSAGSQGSKEGVAEPEQTPDEFISMAAETHISALRSDLLNKSRCLEPYAFEALVIRLLKAMGYGQSGSLVRTKATGDAGVDGIISQDPLGLDRIYVQAKRFAQENTVGRPAIQAFMGALSEKQGDRGVFITTSHFTKEALAAAEKMNARIELIDGDRLAQLLVEYKVGIQAELTVTLYRLDEDFFENL